jgi:uncharacterized damage-inducible protein DinB
MTEHAEHIATEQVIVDDQGRPEPPVAGGEAATVLGYLDFQRATLAWKTDGLDAEALNARLATSTMTLGGIVKHMCYVEAWWFSKILHGVDPGPEFSLDLDEDDWGWLSAAADTPGQLRALWQAVIAQSRSQVTRALAAGGMGQLSASALKNGQVLSLRSILCHMI